MHTLSAATNSTGFEDFADDFLGVEEYMVKGPVAAQQPAAPFESFRPTYTEKCGKCNGSGRFRSYTGRLMGDCFACKGAGTFTRLTAPETRAASRAAYAAKKVATATENWSSFAAANVDVANWIRENVATNSFAASLSDSVQKWGSLTDNQLAAVHRQIAGAAQRKADAVARINTAPTVDTIALENAFSKAKASDLKSPKMRVGNLVFSLAKETSANAGAVYVKQSGADGAYLGKVMGGRFLRSRECDATTAETVVSVIADPKGAAIKYGKEFGCCSICARTLTDPASIEAGIGPICAAKFGF